MILNVVGLENIDNIPLNTTSGIGIIIELSLITAKTIQIRIVRKIFDE